MVTSDTERQQILELLPWYLNGTLGGEEADRVKRYLESSPELAEELTFTATVLKEADQEVSVPMLTHERLRAVMDRVDDEPAQQSPLSGFSHWLDKLRQSLNSRHAGWPAGLAVAAALLVAVIVSVPEQQYQVLTNEDLSSATLDLSVEFKAGIGEAEIQEIFRRLAVDATVKSGETYTISLPDETPVREVYDLLQTLNADDRVATAVLPEQD